MLEGRPFKIYMDHKPLVFMFHRTANPWSARQARHIAKIGEFNTDIAHVNGKSNVVADALSRSPPRIDALNFNFDYAAIARDQAADPELQTLKDDSSLSIEQIPLPGSSRPLWCDTSTGRLRPILPRKWTKAAFDLVHNLNHPGVADTVKQIAQRFVWKGMSKQVAARAKTCALSDR